MVLLADELGPADILGMEDGEIAAAAAVRGGPNAHAAIVARSLGVPLAGRGVVVLTEDGREADIREVGRICLPSDDPALALSNARNGWYDSGHLAYRDEDGYLWPVTDRRDRTPI